MVTLKFTGNQLQQYCSHPSLCPTLFNQTNDSAKKNTGSRKVNSFEECSLLQRVENLFTKWSEKILKRIMKTSVYFYTCHPFRQGFYDLFILILIDFLNKILIFFNAYVAIIAVMYFSVPYEVECFAIESAAVLSSCLALFLHSVPLTLWKTVVVGETVLDKDKRTQN